MKILHLYGLLNGSMKNTLLHKCAATNFGMLKHLYRMANEAQLYYCAIGLCVDRKLTYRPDFAPVVMYIHDKLRPFKFDSVQDNLMIGFLIKTQKTYFDTRYTIHMCDYFRFKGRSKEEARNKLRAFLVFVARNQHGKFANRLTNDMINVLIPMIA
jgi:hypothetical protein